MTEAQLMQIATSSLTLALDLAGPVLAAALVVGLLVSVIQTLTQVQETTLSFLPKIVAIVGVLFVAGHWMLSQLQTFTTGLFAQIPHLLGG